MSQEIDGGYQLAIQSMQEEIQTGPHWADSPEPQRVQ